MLGFLRQLERCVWADRIWRGLAFRVLDALELLNSDYIVGKLENSFVAFVRTLEVAAHYDDAFGP